MILNLGLNKHFGGLHVTANVDLALKRANYR